MSNEPETKFSAGAMQATVWNNNAKTKEGEDREFKSETVHRCYKDKEGEWKNTNTLNVGDIPKAMLVLGKAYEYLALKNSEVTEEIVA